MANNGRTILAAILMAVCCASALSRAPGFAEYRAVQESLSRVHPRMRARWLHELGITLPVAFEPTRSDSGGPRLVGKWGRGPSREVTGRDSLVFLSLGSEVAIINFANPDSPVIISEVQASGLAIQSAVRDSFLYIGVSSGAAGIEVWSIEDPLQPVFRGRALTRLTDFYIRDSYAFVTMRMDSPSRDTLKVYNLADPADPRLVGSCPDSGDAVTVSGNTVIQADWNDLHAIDVSDPANPHRVGSYSGDALSVAARNGICCAGFMLSQSPPNHSFTVLDISNPAAIHPIGSLAGAGAYDIYLVDTLAFLSGYESDFPFRIVSIADSAQPRLVGSNASLTQSYATWANPDRAFALVADAGYGLAVFNTADMATPLLDTQVVAASLAYDVALDGNRAYVASYEAGLHILDVSDPTRVATLGNYDTARVRPAAQSCVARDSFAFMPWFSALMFRSVDVTDPSHPVFAGECDGPGPAMDMVLRDSLVYTASNTRFGVFNVARPRAPVLVGSCVLPGDVWDLDVEDTLAYVTSSSLVVVNIARPTSPFIAATWTSMVAVDAVDTIAYLVGNGYVWSVSMARPTQPVVLDTLRIPSWVSDIVVQGSRAYAGGVVLHVLDVSDPHDLREVGQWTPPTEFRRLLASGPYVYAACYEAGVCVLETTAVGVREAPSTADGGRRHRLYPNPAGSYITVDIGGSGATVAWHLLDVSGRVIRHGQSRTEGGKLKIELPEVPAGVYLIDAGPTSGTGFRAAFVKRP